jgi:glycosyltransferase involved in cell wall biosynthesis
MNGVSIIICCYNSAVRLPETLHHIAMQQVPESILWEVIVVNNNSTDNTSEVAIQVWKKYNLCTQFRVINETNPGLSNARRAGILSAQYKYSLFCDDDNWLAHDYIKTAFRIMESHNEIGVLGGKSTAVCEIEPPTWFEEKKVGYAVGQQASQNGDITEKQHVWGAGAVLITTFLSVIYKSGINSLVCDRKGKELTSGGDFEISVWFIIAGYKLWYDDKLTFKHYIPKERLTEDYVAKLWEGFYCSDGILSAYKRLVQFNLDVTRQGRLMLLSKTIVRIVLAKFNILKYKHQLKWRLQDFQLCLNSILIYDQDLAVIQKGFLIPFKKNINVNTFYNHN